MRTRHVFDEQLATLEQDSLRLGGLAEEMLDQAMHALSAGDADLAKEVINMDDLADSLDLYIETRCMRLLSLQQPVSKDLRTIGSILKAATDLERIADFSVDIARAVIHLSEMPGFRPPDELLEMAELVKQMVRRTLRAFVDRDMDAVEHLSTTDDDEIDYRYNRLFNLLTDPAQRERSSAAQCAYLILIAHYLERIADHCTNVAERIYYMETGHLKKSVKLQQIALDLPVEENLPDRDNGQVAPERSP